MPYDSNGNFTLDPGYRAVTGQTVLASQHNPPLEDISSGLSQVVLRSGVAPMLGALNMNSFRVTNLSDGVNDQDAVTVGQLNVVADVGGSINGADTKAALVDDDRFVLTDSEDSFAVKKTTWQNIKDALTTVFNALYVPLTRSVSAGVGLTGGGALSANRTISADRASLAEAQAGTSNDKLMTPLRTAQAIEDRISFTVGAVGTYAMLRVAALGSFLAPGQTIDGSLLRYSNAEGEADGTPSGTWRCMGAIGVSAPGTVANHTTLFLRIS